MPFKPKQMSFSMRKTRKYRKKDKLTNSHLVRGVIEAQETSNDLPFAIQAAYKMGERTFEVPKCQKPVTIYKSIPQEVIDRGTRQDIRVKPSRSRENNLPKYASRAIGSYINQIHKKHEPLS